MDKKTFKKVEKFIEKGEDFARELVPKAKDTFSDLKESAISVYEKGLEGAQMLIEKGEKLREDSQAAASKKADEVVELVSAKADNAKSVALRGVPEKKKNTGKIAAGVAVGALAAAAYAYYKTQQLKNERLKEDYSVKMKRWSELEKDLLEAEAGDVMQPVKVVPKKVYAEGSNARLTDSIVVRISKSAGETFDPTQEGEVLAGVGIAGAIKDKAASGYESIKKKVEEAKVQIKLGKMEAGDKLEEITDKVQDIDIVETVKETVDEAKLQAHLGTLDTKEKFEELKDKAVDLKNKAADTVDELAGRFSEAKSEGFTPNIEEGLKENHFDLKDIGKKLENLKDKAMDKFEDIREDAGEIVEKVKDKAEDLQEDAGELLEKAKDKAEDIKEDAGEIFEKAKDKIEDIKEDADEKVSEKAEDFQEDAGVLLENAKDKIEDIKEDTSEKIAEVREEAEELKENHFDLKDIGKKLDNLKDKAMDKLEDIKEDAGEVVEKVKDKAEDLQEDAGELLEKAKDKFEDLTDGAEEKAEDVREAVEEKAEDLKENRMSSEFEDDLKDPQIPDIGDVAAEEPYEPLGGEEYDEVSFKSEDTMTKVKNVTEKVAGTISEVAGTVKGKLIPEEPYYEKEIMEYEVTIHNGGEEDYYFNPLLIQKYDVRKRQVEIRPIHKEGTTLESIVIRPGETYTAKLAVEKSIGKKEGLVVFEDIMMNNSVLFLLEDEKSDVEEFEEELFGAPEDEDIQ
jgi:F0F1-type ATP synthase membrane subunit b/b'